MAEAELEHSEDYDGGETKGHPPSEMKKEVETAVGDVVKSNMQKILPAAMKALDIAEDVYTAVYPYFVRYLAMYNQLMKHLEPYGVDEITTCFSGLVMMFFGGSLATLTAVWEAVVQGGLEDFRGHLRLLWNEYKSFRNASEEDDKEDLDNDGIPDVEEISAEQYAVRKALLAFRATNPENISKALQALYTIFVAVMATLRLRFARTISLGSAIGDQLSEYYSRFAAPQIAKVIEDEEYHKWIGPIGRYGCRFIGVTIAFRIQRILTTVHTAMKGARTLVRGLTALANRNGYGYLTEGYLDEIVSFSAAIFGIILQLFLWENTPVIIRLILFPLFFLEGILSLFVGISLSVSSSNAEASV